MEVSFSCVRPVIDNEFHHNIVKVAVDPRGNSADFFDNVTTKFMIDNKTDARKTDIHLLNFLYMT